MEKLCLIFFSFFFFFSVKNLHDRWAKDCGTFRELYNQIPDLELKQKIDWGPLLDEKQVSWNPNLFLFKKIKIKKPPSSQRFLYVCVRLWCFGTQKQLNEESFGPNLADVEKQIAAHNILHQAIQFYSTQLTPDSIASSVRARIVVPGGSVLDLRPELISKNNDGKCHF